MGVWIVKKWHRVDNDNSQEIHFSNGKKFRVQKFYNEFDKHYSDWQLLELVGNRLSLGNSWEWVGTYDKMSFAKEMAFYYGIPSQFENEFEGY